MEIRFTTKELIDAIVYPVDTPGNPLRDPRFSEIKKEVSNAASAHSQGVNWERVADLSCGVLRETGKDLTIIAYAVYVAFQISGLSGFAQGLSATSKLLVEGAIVSPTRPVFQRRALQWLLKKMDHVFRSLHEHEVDQQLARLLLEAIQGLDQACSVVLAEQDLGLGRYRKAVREHLERIKLTSAPAAEPRVREARESTETRGSAEAGSTEARKSTETRESTKPSTGTKPEPVTSQTSEPVVTQSGSRDEFVNVPSRTQGSTGVEPNMSSQELLAEESLSSLRKQMAMRASRLREKDPANPIAYRLMRAACWLEVTQPPTVKPNGRTSLGSVSSTVRKRLESLRDKGQWAGVLQQCENLVLTRPFHLDLHRLSGEALLGLGYIDALKTLKIELRGFLERVPKLIGMSDTTGKPLADNGTRAWLQQHILTPSRRSSAAVPVEKPTQDSRDRGEFVIQADTGGLANFQKEVERARSERERFYLWLRLGEVMNERGDYAFARRLFTALVGEGRTLELGSWEPEAFARGLAGLAKAQLAVGESAEFALSKLVVLDAPRAADLLASSQG